MAKVIGMNMAPIYDWTAQWPWVDIIKTGRPWISGTKDTWDDKRFIPVSPQGWPIELEGSQEAKTLFFWGHPLNYPAGEYKFTWQGTGDWYWKGGITVKETGANYQLITIPSGRSGFQLRITNVGPPSSLLRDLQLVRIDYDMSYRGTQWQSSFIEKASGFNTLRFLQWQRTNYPESDWMGDEWPEEEICPGPLTNWYSLYQIGGVPLQEIVDLCNLTKSNCWICLNHTVSDTVAAGLASFIRDTLHPSLKLYVEVGNEVWNSSMWPFSRGYQYFKQIGLDSGYSPDRLQAALFAYAKRASEVHDIFVRVFNGKERLVRVVGAQIANTWVGEQVIKGGGDFDALAVGAYFCHQRYSDPSMEGVISGWTVHQLFQDIDQYALPELEGWINDYARLAQKYGIKLIAYEAGQHLVWPDKENEVIQNLYDLANRSPKMGERYSWLINTWDQAGGGLLCMYNHIMGYKDYGRWGMWESQEEIISDSYKYQACYPFMSFTESPQEPPVGNTPTTTLDVMRALEAWSASFETMCEVTKSLREVITKWLTTAEKEGVE